MAKPPKKGFRKAPGRTIIGKITEVTNHEVDVDNGTNNIYTIQIAPIREEGGLVGAGRTLEDSITVQYWQAGKRPRGWTGPVGQHSPPPTDKEIRLFFDKKVDGVWQLVEPIGWESLD